MKKICVFLVLLLLLCLAPAAYADGVNIEVMIADGMSVVVLTPEVSLFSAESFLGAEERNPDFIMPRSLTRIEDNAFEGIDASRVEISENVASIGSHAFAKCKNLREFHISASVKEIDKDALEGCENVTVYGSTDVAKAFAEAAGFDYVDLNAAEPPVVRPVGREEPPVALPFVKR